jgi:hypothetical protein
MIVGRVNSNLEIALTIDVLDNSYRLQATETILDTGFNGAGT